MAGEDVDPKSSASAAAVPYVFFLFLLEVLPQFFALVSALHMLCSTSHMQFHLVSVLDVFRSSSYMHMLFTFSLSNRMTCFITAILVVLYLVFLIIKSFGKLLIFPTDYEDAQMEWKPSFLIELPNFITRSEFATSCCWGF